MATQDGAMTNEEAVFEYLSGQDSLFEDERQSEPEEAQATEEIPEEPTDEVEEEEIEESEVEDEEVEDDEVEEQEPDAPWMPSSLDELAAAMEVEPDDLKSIRVKTKVDGVEGEATLAEVIKNYQLNKSLTEKSEAFSHERKQFQEQANQVAQAYQSKLQEAEDLTQILEDGLKSQISAIDWETLRREDPAEYTAQRQDFMERIGQIETQKKKLVEKREEDRKKQYEEYMQQHQQVLQWNQEQLMSNVPEYKDLEYMKRDMSELKGYLQSQGVADEEINNITDYRFVVLARKAKMFDEMQTKAAPAKAKAKSKPKFTKPGAARSKANAADTKTKNRYKRAAKTQDIDDWSKVLEDRLF